MKKKLNDLPKSEEFEDEAEKYVNYPIKIPICETHGKNWKEHQGYIDNHDGTASCRLCSWGFQIPGYIRVYNGRVYDLRVG